MARLFFPLLALAGGLVLTGCVDEVVVRDRPGYYGGGGVAVYDSPNPDFYYEGSAPYSRSYGVLVYRDGGYYYRRGNSYVVYNRQTWNHRDWDYYRRNNWEYYHKDRRNYNRDRDVHVRYDNNNGSRNKYKHPGLSDYDNHKTRATAVKTSSKSASKSSKSYSKPKLSDGDSNKKAKKKNNNNKKKNDDGKTQRPPTRA